MTHLREAISDDATSADLAPAISGAPAPAGGRRTLGLIGHDLMTSSFAGEIMRGAQGAAQAQGAVLLMMTTSTERTAEDREVETLLREQVDGVLCASAAHTVIAVPAAAREHPLVVVNAASADPLISSVAPDENACGWHGADALLMAGHRRLVFIADATDGLDSRGREAGFRARAAEAGLTPTDVTVVATTADAAGGFEAATRLLAGDDRPTAVLCVNDRVAVGVYRAAATLGLNVPQDVSVIGIGGADSTAQAMAPPMTTVQLPHREIGAWAAEHLLELIRTGMQRPQAVRIAGRLAARDSVAGPPIA